ncbi:hypothetical protein SNE40_006175 [Patella caerulea]|uniref:Uncharacterized protein n=1 Tax=Patella caerulea TaxID=87958 RepID=A0AAN8JWA4_PATCE
MITHSPVDVEELTAFFSITLSNFLDKHAPVSTKPITVKSLAPWYSDSIVLAKTERRRAERRWKKIKIRQLEVNRHIYVQKRQNANKLLKSEKAKFCSQRISLSSGNAKALYSLMSSLLGKPRDVTLPHTDDISVLSNNFSDYFLEKIPTIRNSLGIPDG